MLAPHPAVRSGPGPACTPEDMSLNTAREPSSRVIPITQRPVVKQGAIALGQAALIVAAMFVFLDGRHRDITVPFHFAFDSLVALMQSKSTVDNGWWWFNPMIGAPFGLDELAFPANSNVDQALVWIVSRVVRDAITATNITWILMVVQSGLAATWCLRRLGGSTIAAVVCGTLFAVTPYALYRNIGHLWMVIYLLPFACTLALLLATGRLQSIGHWRQPGSLLLVGGAVLIGFNYVYYAFFACFFIAAGAVIGYFVGRDRRVLRTGAICVVLVAAATVLNLAPSLYSWKRHGLPIPLVMIEKTPAESEIYGLKVRHLVSPVIQHTFGPLGWWMGRELAAKFPNENENRTTRLGVIGSVGFLVLLGVALVPWLQARSPASHLLEASSRLTLAAVLFATVGGFGSVFSLLVSPEIRAYNRIAPFIAFFSLAAVMVLLEAGFRRRGARLLAAGAVLAVGLIDQGVAATDLNIEYPAIARQMPPLRDFVATLEQRLPDQAMVLQLPFRTYLYDRGVARMEIYEHLKLYLVSHHLRWSYPALSNEQNRWQQAASRLGPGRLARQVAAEGFAAIVVDRYGYGDNGVAVTAAVSAELSPRDVLASTDRFVAYDIRPLAQLGAPGPPLSAPPAAATAKMNACPDEGRVYIDRIDEEAAPFIGLYDPRYARRRRARDRVGGGRQPCASRRRRRRDDRRHAVSQLLRIRSGRCRRVLQAADIFHERFCGRDSGRLRVPGLARADGARRLGRRGMFLHDAPDRDRDALVGRSFRPLTAGFVLPAEARAAGPAGGRGPRSMIGGIAPSRRSLVNACTIIARNYLAHARVLASSFFAHHPDGAFTILLIDDEQKAYDAAGEAYRCLRLAEIGFSAAEIGRLAAYYDVTELATAVKPMLLRHLLAAGAPEIIYLDPDIRLYGSLTEAARLSREHGILLTPHILAPIPRDGRRVDEFHILAAGVYNLGFIGVGAGAAGFLDWWWERTRRDARIDPSRMMFTDQRWIDFVPSCFHHWILKDPGYNVAYWNLHERDLIRVGDAYVVNGSPLAFFHFSGFDGKKPYLLSKHQGPRPRILLSERPAVAQICREYLLRLEEEGVAEHSGVPYGWNRLRSGLFFDVHMRRVFREAMLASDRDRVPEPPQPFDAESERRFLEWLNEPARGSGSSGITRYLAAIYQDRSDVQYAFPRVPGEDAEGYLGWIRTDGVVQQHIPPALMPAVRTADSRGGGIAAPAPPLAEGVNVAGYFRAELGVGEAARLLTTAIDAAGIPHSTVAYDMTPSRQAHQFTGRGDGSAPYDVNILCVNADQTARFAGDVGRGFFQGRHTIGYWFWELDQFPPVMHQAFEYVDEVWAATRFVASGIGAIGARPVYTIPLPVAVPRCSPDVTRRGLNLPEGFLFLFVFDFFSILERKNPLGLIEAFKRAFTPGEGPTLLLKSINGHQQLEDLERVRAAAADRPDILVVDEYYSAEEKGSLIGLCDCYVSLHRSEGLGLTMAEAMALGKPVIATAYSGNLDFMTGREQLPGRLLAGIRPGRIRSLSEGQPLGRPETGSRRGADAPCP